MNSLITPRRWILHRVSTDILIIGSGVAGLRAGIEASEYGKVIIATKGKFSDGNTNEAQGGIAVVLSQGDTFTQHIQDTLSAGAGLCRKEAVEILTREGPERVKELFDWGAHFDSKEGDLLFTQEGGHSLRRVIHAQGDATGREIENTLFSRLYRCRNFRIWENAFAVELMVRDNTCYGAYLYTPKEGLYAVLADRVILSTGGAARVYRETTNHRVATGDGIAMVYRAGGELQDMEFLQFHPTALYVAGASRLLISEAVRGEGGILKNKYGERFMVKYHPQADLAPRDVVSRAILDEMKMTESTNVYLDVRGIPYSTLKKRFPNLASICKEVGLDIRRDLIPVRPSAHYTIGGVRVDLNGRTSIRNLFACGETASSGVHGANRLASNSLLEGLVFGYRVGKEAGISLCREIKRVKKIVYPK
ncbi:MAG TPA: L-aspartate oxidase, partial [Candidatus Omnitrophica bacterium]|nr:L-aspartate oxidase [Candidatus Omnitrophota bacterium]